MSSKKCLYCQNCGTYPDEIIQIEKSTIKRKWNGTLYELVESVDSGTLACPICKSELSDES